MSAIKFEKHGGVAVAVAVMHNGTRVPCYNKTQLMMARRLTTIWEDASGNPVDDHEVYLKLHDMVGYYV